MSQEEHFGAALDELYQGEVTGEVVFYRLLERFESPDQRYKLASLLQLETEAKARLRPAIMAMRRNPAELDDSRKQGNDFAETFEGMDWKEAMAHLAALNEPFVARYREIARRAPAEYKALAESMAIHEQSIQTFAELESAGEGRRSIDGVVAQLIHPLGGESRSATEAD